MSFIEELFVWKKDHHLAFHPVVDVFRKIATMEAQERRCVCDVSRTCPCEEGLDEIRKNGKCKCSLFCSYEFANHYLYYWFYINSSGETIPDGERKRLVKEREEADRVVRSA